MDVGFLGLGQMGSAIAERLQDSGARLHVYDPNDVALAPFILRGAVDHDSAAAVADSATIVFACLPDGAASESAARQVATGNAVRIYVEMSTIGSAALTRVQDIVAPRGITLVDCPISGGPKGARAGTLTVITAGPETALAEIRPWLHRIGNVFEVGDRPGQAQLMKLVNNLIGAANMAAAFEALVLGAKGGLDARQMVDVINVSTGRNSATLDKVPRAVLPGTFDYGAHLSTMVKDVTLGLQEARALGVPMWVLETVGQLWRFGEYQGLGKADFTSLIKIIEGWAGTEVRDREGP
ncbi:MAG TPA: NAD(P)-dependent oxidoreductase [Acetobacteraceae bacterium]|nr:NAD(P)-dependent oxidoreductase [Acetobacteraceae bacterium]